MRRLVWILTSEDEEEVHHDEGVAKVEKCRDETLNLQFGDKVMYTIDEEIYSSKP